MDSFLISFVLSVKTNARVDRQVLLDYGRMSILLGSRFFPVERLVRAAKRSKCLTESTRTFAPCSGANVASQTRCFLRRLN